MVSNRRAFDPSFSQFSPGMLTMLRALEDASDEGLTRVEFLGGPEPYKLEFSTPSNRSIRASGSPAACAGRALAQAEVAMLGLCWRVRHSEALHRLYVDRLAPARRLARRFR